MFRLRRNGEFVLPPERRHFASETAKHRGFCEAAYLTTLGPYVQNAHNLGIRKGSGLPLRTFSLGFGAAETAFHLTRVKEMNTSNESRKIMFAQS